VCTVCDIYSIPISLLGQHCARACGQEVVTFFMTLLAANCLCGKESKHSMF